MTARWQFLWFRLSNSNRSTQRRGGGRRETENDQKTEEHLRTDVFRQIKVTRVKLLSENIIFCIDIDLVDLQR